MSANHYVTCGNLTQEREKKKTLAETGHVFSQRTKSK